MRLIKISIAAPAKRLPSGNLPHASERKFGIAQMGHARSRVTR